MTKALDQIKDTAIRLITETGVPSPASAWAFIRYEFRVWDLASIIQLADKGDAQAVGCLGRMTEFYRPFGEQMQREG